MNRERLAFEQVSSKYAGKVFSQGYLQAVKAIDNNSNTYKLNFKTNESADLVIERKLDRNDTFVALSVTYGIAPIVSAEYGRMRVQTYPNFTAFPEVTASGNEFDPNDLELFWNGYISMKVGSIVQIEALPTSLALDVPQTQQSSSSNRSQKNGRDAGTIELDPYLIVGGSQNFEVSLTVPLFSGAKVANTNTSTVNYVVARLNGFLVKETGGI